MTADLSRYQADIDLSDANNSRVQQVLLTGRDKSVLDVGCAAGDTALALIDAGCRVSGVDIEDALRPEARERLDRFVVADVEQKPLAELFESETFDVVILGDILEHLADPLAVLRSASRLLGPGGQVVITVPNVAHGSVRLSLLRGRWDYTDTGLLDPTHLRFFTRESISDLVEEAGLRITALHATVVDPLGAEVEVDASRLPATVVDWVRHQRDAMCYQYVLTARPTDVGSEQPPRPALQVLAPLEEVRRHDDDTVAMAAEQAAAQRAMTIRDHVIGLEASTATALAKAKSAQAKLHRAQVRGRRLRQQLTQLIDEVDRLPEGRRQGRLRRLAENLDPRSRRDDG